MYHNGALHRGSMQTEIEYSLCGTGISRLFLYIEEIKRQIIMSERIIDER